VKDFVREYWKSAAAGAAGSFLLSLLVGLVTRNPFGVVFLRALLLAVLFACLAAALRYLVRTHLLELAKEGASAHAGVGETREDRRGDRVDIVLPEESPIGRERYGMSGRESRPFGPDVESPSPLGAGLGEDGAILNAGLAEEGADVPGGFGADVPGGFGADEANSEGLAELAEELAEELPQPGEADEVRGGTVAEEESGARRRAGAPGHGNATTGAGPGISDDRDGLPDISNLEIATEMNSDGQGAPTGTRPGGPRPEDALRGAVSGQDPATIAKAIRTVLKRDDKG
jgi:hypothetical protein